MSFFFGTSQNYTYPVICVVTKKVASKYLLIKNIICIYIYFTQMNSHFMELNCVLLKYIFLKASNLYEYI